MKKILNLCKRINLYDFFRCLIIILDFLIFEYIDIEKLNKVYLTFLIFMNIYLIVIIILKLGLNKENNYKYLAQSIYYGSIASATFSIMIFGHYLISN